MKLKAIIKTILEGADSSWVLFIYTAITKNNSFHHCDEGDLEWVPLSKVSHYNLIGFIKEIFPLIIQRDNEITEGTIFHDINGNVIKKVMHIAKIKEYV